MKIITSAKDLAVNRAAPAFSQPLHVGRPNIGDREDFARRLNGALDRGWLTNDGPLVRELEDSIAAFLGAKHCIAMCNGTVALEIAIRALGLSGEVIVPSYTFVATAHALHWQAITPVFADIDPTSHNIDPASVRKLITPKTSGIVGVHLWGRAAQHVELQKIADENGLQLMYDAAHAFGCSLDGTMIGNFGACEVLSFHATKFFNTFEGGAVVTNNDELAHRIKLMRNFGFAGYDRVIHPGTNGKMVEACAAMGITNLDSLDHFVSVNKRNYLAYQKHLASVPELQLIQYDDAERNNYQYIVIEVQPGSNIGRDEIVAALHAENVLARKYFWPGCHLMQPYIDLFPDAGLSLPNTRVVADRVIVLPTGSSISESAIETIVAILKLLVRAT